MPSSPGSQTTSKLFASVGRSAGHFKHWRTECAAAQEGVRIAPQSTDGDAGRATMPMQPSAAVLVGSSALMREHFVRILSAAHCRIVASAPSVEQVGSTAMGVPILFIIDVGDGPRAAGMIGTSSSAVCPPSATTQIRTPLPVTLIREIRSHVASTARGVPRRRPRFAGSRGCRAR
jgi:hypothetical protein